MSRDVIDLSVRDYRASAAAAATETWLLRTVRDGAWPPEAWPVTMHRTTTARAKELSSLTVWTDRTALALPERWTLRQASWADVFDSLLATPPTRSLDGDGATRALGDHRELGAQVRLAVFTFTGPRGQPVRGQVAAVVAEHTVQIFEPGTGSVERDRPLTSADRSQHAWFMQVMAAAYPGAATLTCVTHVVEVANVFITWFGPPAAQRDPNDNLWPDVKGAIAVAQGARTPDGGRPHVTLVCMAQHRQGLEQRLRTEGPAVAGSVDVRSVEDHFSEGLAAPGAIPAADFDDLRTSVRDIMAASFQAGDKRSLVNAKNIWSMYCLHAFGGYLLDSGVILTPGATTATLPTPDRLAMMYFVLGMSHGGGNGTTTYAHTHLRAAPRRGFRCITASLSPEGPNLQLYQDAEQVASGGLDFEKIDVGIMRAPRGSRGARIMLATYVDLWHRITAKVASNEFSDVLRKGYFRGAVIGAAATGLSHPVNKLTGCGVALPREGVNIFKDASLGLLKTGTGSHL